jgi:hypothetical protein
VAEKLRQNIPEKKEPNNLKNIQFDFRSFHKTTVIRTGSISIRKEEERNRTEWKICVVFLSFPFCSVSFTYTHIHTHTTYTYTSLSIFLCMYKLIVIYIYHNFFYQGLKEFNGEK